jgi:hypothetical protein
VSCAARPVVAAPARARQQLRGLEEVGACPDAEEFVEVEIVAVAELIEAIRLGQITDPKTVLGVFAVERMQRGEWAWPQFEQINSA